MLQSVGIDPEEFEQGVRELQRTLWPTVIDWPEYVAATVLSVQLALAIKVFIGAFYKVYINEIH